MNEKNDSLLEIAISVMKKKKNPQTLESIQNEVFAKKGIEMDANTLAQFEVDFMLCGQFIYCGEDKNGNQVWDLKERQPSSLLDKDAGIISDIYADDEDVIKNELKDDTVYDKSIDEYISDDDVEEKVEDEDDIEEELGLVSEDSETREIDSSVIDFDEDEEEEEEEEDDIEIELRKQK